MLLLHLVSFLVGVLAVAFATLCLASGLLYLAEMIEENAQSAKRFGKQLIHVIIFAHLAFYFSDGLPLSLVALGIFSHLVYLSNFSRTWPSIPLTSASFISSCCLVIVDHFAWFFYFADRVSHPHHHPIHRSWSSNPNRLPDQLTFIDITTFFALCVWIAPFFLFLSLSASDNVLPNTQDNAVPRPMLAAQASTTSDGPEAYYTATTQVPSTAPRARSMLKGMLQNCITTIPRLGSHGGGRTSSRPNEGLLGGPTSAYASCPSSPPTLTAPFGPGPSPPTSPAKVSQLARRLSFGRNAATTSPRRAFSSKFDDHRAFSPPLSMPSPRHVSSSAAFSLANSLPLSDHDDLRCAPRLPLDHIFAAGSPRPPSFH